MLLCSFSYFNQTARRADHAHLPPDRKVPEHTQHSKTNVPEDPNGGDIESASHLSFNQERCRKKYCLILPSQRN